MPLHPKARRRITIVLITGALLLLVAAGGYVLRKRQLATRLVRGRDDGYACLTAGDYYNAMHKIGPYLKRNPTDVEALFKYGIACEHVEVEGGKHIIDAIGIYRQLLSVKPDHPEARKNLLKLYVDAGFNSEILSATEGRKDEDSVRARLFALGRTGRAVEAMDAATKYLERKPTDLQVQLFVLALLEQGGAKPDELVARARQLQAANLEDPRFEVLLSVACSRAGDEKEALKWARSAASHSVNDPELVTTSVSQLDLLGDHEAALSLLERAADVRVDAGYQRDVIARLYQSGQFNEVLKRTADAERLPDQADVELLGHRALALASLNRVEDSRRVIGLISARKDDFAAAAWARVLSAVPYKPSSSDSYQIIAACRDGLKSRAENPYFRLCLGDAYARVGESGIAIEEWAQAAAAAPVWATPRARVLLTLLKSGPVPSVGEMADQVERLNPRDPDTLSVVAMARARTVRGMSDADKRTTLEFAERVQKLKPGEEASLGLKLIALDAMGRSDEARSNLLALLRAEPPLSEAALIVLASASEASKLGLEQACFERSLVAHGPSVPLAWAQATWLGRKGQSQEAAQTFESQRAGAKERGATVEWQIAWASLLDGVGDNRAASLWPELADANPQDLSIQERVLSSPSVQKNRDLHRRAIDRIHAVLGESGTNWRLADARWTFQAAMLESNDVERQKGLAKSASVLNDLIRRNPDFLQARLMLADCLLQLNNRQGAAEQLSAAVHSAPRLLPAVLQLASLYQSMKDFDKAKPLLDQAEQLLKDVPAAGTTAPTPDATAPPVVGEPPAAAALPQVKQAEEVSAAWRTLASLYLARGETDHALSILRRIERDQPAAQQTDVARILARRGELTDDVRRDLLAHPSLETIEIVADSYARQGRTQDADQTLALLANVEARPGEKDFLRANIYQREGETAKAIEHLRLASVSMPQNASIWRSLVRVLLLDGKGDQAISAATDARQKLPEEPAFKQVLDQQELIRAMSDAAIARPLLAAFVDDGQDPAPLAAALRIMADGRASNKTVQAVAFELRPLADRAPLQVALQNLLIELYRRIGSYDEAAGIAARLMRTVPTDPAPARRYAESLAAAGRWDEVISVAKEWRDRLGAETLPADTMLAMAYLAARNPQAACAQLDPHVGIATRDPVKHADVLQLYAQALVTSGRFGDARALLEPALSSAAPVRSAWIQVASQLIANGDVAAQWLDYVDPLITNSPNVERFVLAKGRAVLARRLDLPNLRAAAATAVQQLGDAMREGESKDPNLWMTLGVLQESQKDDTLAERSYRRSIELGSTDPVAPNNLAMIIVRRGGDLTEAAQLAEKATRDRENPNRHEFLDTLALIQSKSGQHDAAVKSISEAIDLQPNSASFRARRVEILLSAGRADEAKDAFGEFEKLVSAQRQRDPALVAKVDELRPAIQASPAGPK